MLSQAGGMRLARVNNSATVDRATKVTLKIVSCATKELDKKMSPKQSSVYSPALLLLLLPLGFFSADNAEDDSNDDDTDDVMASTLLGCAVAHGR